MAAPRNTYRNYPLVNDEEESLVGVPTANKVTLLDRFYLDDILVIQKQDDVTNATEYGIIGMVENGSQNYEMHNASRFFVLRGYENHIMLNDAGFNTKGVTSTPNTPDLKYSNYFKLTLDFKSAYWVDSDQIGFQMRKKGTPTWYNYYDGALARNTELLNHEKTITTMWAYEDIVEYRAVNENAEGIYYGEIKEAILDDAVHSTVAFRRTTACNETNEVPITLWTIPQDLYDLENFGTPQQSGVITLYTDIERTQTLPQNTWLYGLYENRSYRIGALGEVAEYVECAYPVPTLSLSIYNDQNGMIVDVIASIDSPRNGDVVITGRIDVNQTGGQSPSGKNFSITINQGDTTGKHEFFNLNTNPSYSYYFRNISVTPNVFQIYYPTPIEII